MWQKIGQNTPRDGRDIDLWVRRETEAVTDCYRVANAYWQDGEWWAPDRDWEGAHGPLFTYETATHWMPLPAPPTAEGE